MGTLVGREWPRPGAAAGLEGVVQQYREGEDTLRWMWARVLASAHSDPPTADSPSRVLCSCQGGASDRPARRGTRVCSAVQA